MVSHTANRQQGAETFVQRTGLTLSDLLPDVTDFGPIAEKADRMAGVHMGDDVVMTRLWSGHMMMTSTRDMIVTPHLINIGINEPHVTRTLMSLIRPGDTVVDIGANIGYFSVLGGWRAFPGGQIWSFEPNLHAYRRLTDNITTNGFAAMAKRFNIALSDRSGTAPFRVFPGYEATSTIRDVPEDYVAHTARETGRESHVVEVAVARLDDIMRDVREIHMVKIDVEGHEPAVIRGAQEILRRSPEVKVVMEFMPPIMGLAESRELLALLRRLDFAIFRLEVDATLTILPDDDLLAIPFSDLLLLKRATLKA